MDLYHGRSIARLEAENVDLRRQLAEARQQRDSHDGYIAEDIYDLVLGAAHQAEADLADCRRSRWHHNPDAPPEHFCPDCDQQVADLAAARADAEKAWALVEEAKACPVGHAWLLKYEQAKREKETR